MKRTTAARLAGLQSWANTPDRSARAGLGQTGLEGRFLREARERLGPEATDRQIAEAADSARKAHFTRLAEARWGPKRAATTP